MPHLCSLSLNTDPWTSFIRVCHIQCRGARGAPGAAQREPRMRRNQPSGLVRDVSGPHPCPRPPCQPGRAGCPPGGALYPSLEAQKRRGRGGEEPPWTVRMKAPIGPRACSPCLCPGPAHWRPQAPAGEDSPLQPALQLPAPCLVRSWAKRFTLPTLRLFQPWDLGQGPSTQPVPWGEGKGPPPTASWGDAEEKGLPKRQRRLRLCVLSWERQLPAAGHCGAAARHAPWTRDKEWGRQGEGLWRSGRPCLWT